MVHPYMRQSHHTDSLTDGGGGGAADALSKVTPPIISMLSRLHVLVIGPGLGRDPLMQDTCARVIQEARACDLPFVLDADGLYLAQTRPELVQDYALCILTPNVVEFARLAKTKGIKINDKSSGGRTDDCQRLAEAFGGVTVIQKGAVDVISNGRDTMTCDLEGGLKRSGGQGDTLTGCLATFLAWRKAYLDGIWEHDGDIDSKELFALAALGGSAITRECSRLAFKKKGRSLQASDLTEEVNQAYLNLFENGGSKL
ncbi:MAG: hypothetical protein M1825_002351 [Sarcosagium campestre]|nr:MAG: hypothetical protein M1825_002351 [Sarcosagium campestre]